jgi:tetratricopeptide (TPR) repeat protein
VRRAAPALVLSLLVSVCFSLATILQPRTLAWRSRRESGGVLKAFLGDGRKLFANQFFVKADVAFHSGYYPSIFDQAQAPKDTAHLTAKEGSTEEAAHEKAMNFLEPPRDWIERFGRHFFITQHTHLEGGHEREILPWLKLSAELDPQRVDTYTVAAYWLRDLGKVTEAEQFLREGLRNNPTSYELLFEMGRLYMENYHDLNRARNVWELALRRWSETESKKKDPDLIGYHQIVIHLGRMEEQAGNYARAVECFELAVKVSPSPEALQEQIAELKQKMAAQGGDKPAGP